MKPWINCVVFAIVGGVIAIGAAGKLAAPSELYSKPAPYDMRFVLHQMEDLRHLFCDRDTLADRRARGVCRVDSVLIASWQREVPVFTNSTVADVLQHIGLTNWNGGHQIRFVSKNAILQSAFPRNTGTRDARSAFLGTAVRPGDLIVLCLQD
jgi:hypothetical protein